MFGNKKIFSHFNRTTEHLTVYFYFGATYPFVMVHSTSLLWCVLPLRCGAFWPCVGSFYPAAALGLFVEILEKIDESKQKPKFFFYQYVHEIFLHYLKSRMVIISLDFPSKTQFLLKGCVLHHFPLQ